ncbi:unnamed protein product [Effrenium voratum]|nr:unnamed protein product [Effrenium voratum]
MLRLAWLCLQGALAQDIDLEALLGGLGGMSKGGKGGSDRLCPTGKIPVPKLDHHERMMANGCGPQGLVIKEPYGLYRCCNSHDVCFSVCGTSHKFCEDQFSRCMNEVCEQKSPSEREECTQQATSFSSMTKAFGKGFHQASQKDSCECAPKAEAKERHREYLENFYRAYNSSKQSDAHDDLSEWGGKEAELYFDLVKTYGHMFVEFTDVPKQFDAIPKGSIEL